MKKSILFSLLAVVLSLTACKKYFGDVNTNPNNPLSVEPKVILPGIETAISYSLGGDAARFSAILNQQLTGIDRQWTVLEKYKFVGSDVEELYETNIYTKVLVEIHNLKIIANENGYHHYNGVAKTLEAYTLLFVTDFWDASPYSDAFKGFNNLQPKYDSQAELYSTVFSLLADARSDLNQPNGGSKVPAEDDLMYGGDITKWIGLTNFIEARANLRLAKNNASKYQDALTAINSGLTADWQYPYSGGAFAHPMNQFNVNWGSVALGNRITELLTTYNDPRMPLYNQPFDESNTYFTDNKNHVIASLIEQEFIMAECKFQISGPASAYTNYINGITLALQRDGVSSTDITTYLAQNSVDPGAGSITLEHIINQKYLALILEHETFTDWRRTGFPTLVPNNGSVIPRRFQTPQSELNLNAGNVPQSTIFSRVTWDN